MAENLESDRDRLKSLLGRIISLLGRINSLFAHLGNCPEICRDSSGLRMWIRPKSGTRRRFSRFLPVDQGRLVEVRRLQARKPSFSKPGLAMAKGVTVKASTRPRAALRIACLAAGSSGHSADAAHVAASSFAVRMSRQFESAWS